MTEAIITVENLGKKYRIRHQADRQRYRRVYWKWARVFIPN